ncbi:MAG: DUF86 domain-containing protein [Phormidesmis sp.]
MAGFRDLVIHEYFRVDMDMVWDVMSNDIPQLKPQLERIVTEKIVTDLN